ncbi:hypothetical protein D3C87_2039590 [compost metagenome]
MVFIVLRQYLEIIVFRHGDGAVHGGVDELADAFGEGGILMLFDVDTNQWHGMSPDRRPVN